MRWGPHFGAAGAAGRGRCADHAGGRGCHLAETVARCCRADAPLPHHLHLHDHFGCPNARFGWSAARNGRRRQRSCLQNHRDVRPDVFPGRRGHLGLAKYQMGGPSPLRAGHGWADRHATDPGQLGAAHHRPDLAVQAAKLAHPAHPLENLKPGQLGPCGCPGDRPAYDLVGHLDGYPGGCLGDQVARRADRADPGRVAIRVHCLALGQSCAPAVARRLGAIAVNRLRPAPSRYHGAIHAAAACYRNECESGG